MGKNQYNRIPIVDCSHAFGDEARPYKGFVSMESLVTLLIWLILLGVVFQTLHQASEQHARYLEQQERWDKLVSAADFIVKRGVVYAHAEAVYPNWIEEAKLAALDQETLGEKLGLEKLQVSWNPGAGVCLYRIVARGEQKEIAQLWVCGF